MKNWNKDEEPIANRLRDDDELHIIQNNKSMMYHEPSKQTALIMDVWIVDPVEDDPSTMEEDRFVRYTTEDSIKEDFAVDLDDEGWLWHDQLTMEQL